MVNEVLAGLPKYESPAYAIQSGEEHEGVVLLPRLDVRAQSLPRFSERERHTKSGMSDLLYRRYPGASFRGQDPENSRTSNYAAVMYRDDKRLEQSSQLKYISKVSALDGGEDGRLEEEIELMFLRRPDWRTEGMDRSINRWRN
jgi:hypothetical protein